VIGLDLNAGKHEEAAQLAMRMMVEDEFIINSAFDILVVDSILRFMREPNLRWSKETTLQIILEFWRMRKSGKRTALDIERTFDKFERAATLVATSSSSKITGSSLESPCNGSNEELLLVTGMVNAGNLHIGL
jgi:hypothetical protein